MKVLLYHLMPFALAGNGTPREGTRPTGLAVAAEGWPATVARTRAAIEAAGIEVDFLRWYDGRQTGDVIHFFGRIPSYLIPFVHQKQMKVVVTEAFAASRPASPFRLAAQSAAIRVMEKTLPGPVLGSFDWDSYRLVDACVVSTEAEALRLKRVFRVPAERIHVVAYQSEDVDSQIVTFGKWLSAIYDSLRRTS
jgi:hypothetical protein